MSDEKQPVWIPGDQLLPRHLALAEDVDCIQAPTFPDRLRQQSAMR
jgi:hypothetical protein